MSTPVSKEQIGQDLLYKLMFRQATFLYSVILYSPSDEQRRALIKKAQYCENLSVWFMEWWNK